MNEIVEFQYKGIVLNTTLYCRVALQVDILMDDTSIQFESKDDIINDYLNVIKFSLDCFVPILNKKYPRCGAKIVIHRFGAFDVDTRNVIALYVMLSALCKAIKYNLEGFVLDFDKGVLSIPVGL